MFCRAFMVIILCVTTRRLAWAGSSGDDVRCGHQLCDGRTEYCDPLIEICTPCEMPCSRTTLSDGKLCKRLCPGYKKSHQKSTTTEVTHSTALTESDDNRGTLNAVLVYVFASFILLLVLVAGVCVLLVLQVQKLKCKCPAGMEEEGCRKECVSTPHAHATHENQSLVIGSRTCKEKDDIDTRRHGGCEVGSVVASAACVAPVHQPKKTSADIMQCSNDGVAHGEQSKGKAPLDQGQIDSGVGGDLEIRVPLMQTTVKTLL